MTVAATPPEATAMRMPRIRFSVRGMMVAVAGVAILLFLDPYVTGGYRGSGSIDVEVNVLSLSGRHVIGLAYEPGQIAAQLPSYEFREQARWSDGVPVIKVRTAIAGYGCIRQIVSRYQERRFVLRIDFDDCSSDYVGIELPHRFRPGPVKSVTVLVE